MAQVPNINGTVNPFVATGGQFGTIVAASTSETLGFYGNTGVVQPTAASVTDYASLKVALQALGLIGS